MTMELILFFGELNSRKVLTIIFLNILVEISLFTLVINHFSNLEY